MIDRASFTPSLQEVKRLLNGVLPGASKVAPEHPMHPRTLVSVIRDQADADLGYRNGQRIMGDDSAVARFHAAVEQELTMYVFEAIQRHAVHPCAFRRSRASC